jgi:hypothetical protein
VDILDDPGSADLSAYVDFASIKRSAEEASGLHWRCHCTVPFAGINSYLHEIFFSPNLRRRYLGPWANDAVPVPGFSRHQLQSRSSPAELHRGAGGIIADGLLATGWRRGSPVLGRPRGPGGTCWNGHQVLGHGHCQQEAGHAHSVRVRVRLGHSFPRSVGM